MRDLGRQQWAAYVAAHEGHRLRYGGVGGKRGVRVQQQHGIEEQLAHQRAKPGEIQRPGGFPGDSLNECPKLGEPLKQGAAQMPPAVTRPATAARDPVDVRLTKRRVFHRLRRVGIENHPEHPAGRVHIILRPVPCVRLCQDKLPAHKRERPAWLDLVGRSPFRDKDKFEPRVRVPAQRVGFAKIVVPEVLQKRQTGSGSLELVVHTSHSNEFRARCA